MRLRLLRHAPVLLPPGTCYGASDVAADDALTVAAARRWAPDLADGARIRVSTLSRARQLADAILELSPDLGSPIVDPRLAEMDFGDWELRRWDSIPAEAFDGWIADFAHHEVGGGESTQAVIDRVAEAIDDERSLGGDAVWITHAGVIRAVTYIVGGGSRPIASVDDWPRAAPLPGDGIEVRLPPIG